MTLFKVSAISFLSLNLLLARFATEEDLDFDIEKSQDVYTVHKDGSYEVDSEVIYSIKKEAARSYLSKRVLTYRDKTEKLEVIEAKTVVGDKEFPVEKTAIEDKALASSSNGFEDKRQVIVAFPKAEVGTKLVLKTRFKSNLIITKDHFYTKFRPISDAGWVKHTDVKIKSEIPLNVQVNDPRNLLKIDGNGKDFNKEKVNDLSINLAMPATELTVDDIPGELDVKKSTWINISSLDDWKPLLKDLLPKYEEILSAPLPQLYKDIIEEASKEKTEKDKIEKVMALLADRVQYLGSWMTFKGMFIPRTLEDVEKSRFGDCKDFSTATVAILRAMGLKADVVFVERSYQPEELPSNSLPVWFANHAIAKAVGENGKVYWLDPTNFTSSIYVLQDIANRPVLVPADDNKLDTALQKIPSVEPFVYEKEQELKITEDNRIENKTTFTWSESCSNVAMFTGIHLRTPKTIVESMIYSAVVGYAVPESDKIAVEMPNLTSRIIAPIKFSVQYRSNDIIKSNIGHAYVYESSIPLIKEIISINETNVNNWSVDNIGVYKTRIIIPGKQLKNLEKLNEETTTKWFSVSRKATIHGKDTVVEITSEIKQEKIKNEDLKSEEFLQAQKKINRSFRKIVLEIE